MLGRGRWAAATLIIVGMLGSAAAEGRTRAASLGFCPSNINIVGGMMGGTQRCGSPALVLSSGSAMLGASLFGGAKGAARRPAVGALGANMMFDQLSGSIEGVLSNTSTSRVFSPTLSRKHSPVQRVALTLPRTQRVPLSCPP